MLNSHLRLWFSALLSTILAVLISSKWIDEPVALRVRDTFGSRGYAKLVSAPGLSIPLASTIVFLIFGIVAIGGGKPRKFGTAIVLSDIALIAADTTKDHAGCARRQTLPDYRDSDRMSCVSFATLTSVRFTDYGKIILIKRTFVIAWGR